VYGSLRSSAVDDGSTSERSSVSIIELDWKLREGGGGKELNRFSLSLDTSSN